MINYEDANRALDKAKPGKKSAVIFSFFLHLFNISCILCNPVAVHIVLCGYHYAALHHLGLSVASVRMFVSLFGALKRKLLEQSTL